jgi:predicted NBD/HSP70 family sugar kinase
MLEIINSNYKVNDVFKRFSHYLALLVNNIIYLLDPDFIFISGKVVYSLDLFKKYFFKKLSSLITMIDNYDINRVVFLTNDSNKYNIFNLLGSVFMDKFI